MADKLKCALGMFAAYGKRLGNVVDEAKLNAQLGDDYHAKTKYAAADQRYNESVVGATAAANSVGDKAAEFMKSIGVDTKTFYSYLAKPSTVLGEDLVQKVESVYQKHYKDGGIDLKSWSKTGGAEIKQIRDEFMAKSKPELKDYADKYFKRHIQGGQFFNNGKGGSPLTKYMRQGVGNLVTQNPMITALNVFEFMPKALAYAISEKGAIEGTGAIFKGMASFAQKSGGKFWSKIPELEAKGIYGQHADVANGLSKYNLLSLTENPLRGLAHEVDVALGGTGTKGVDNIAFVPRFGNEPMSALDYHGTDSLALMRYSIASSKMYLGMMKQAIGGDINAAMGLAAFTAMTALQTGSASAIPIPVYNILPGEAKQFLSDFDDQTGLNITKHTLGTDIKSSVQPLAAPALGAGYSILTQDIGGGFNALKKSAIAAEEGDAVTSGTRLIEGAMGLGLVAKIPGVNVTSKRFTDAFGAALRGEIGYEEVPMEWAKKTKLMQEPEE